MLVNISNKRTDKDRNTNGLSIISHLISKCSPFGNQFLHLLRHTVPSACRVLIRIAARCAPSIGSNNTSKL